MYIEYNSHNSYFKKPFGALKCGQEARFRIKVYDRIPEKAVLIVNDGHNVDRLEMHFFGREDNAYIFEMRYQMPAHGCMLEYFFEVETKESCCYYGNNPQGTGGLGKMYAADPEKYRITVFQEDYKTPDWFKNGIVYQIFVDRFYRGKEGQKNPISKREDILFHENWNDVPFYEKEQFGGVYHANDFFGGNLQGIIEKLDYLKSLHVTVLYLNPIFKAYSNHKYDTGDYQQIDPMFGTNEKFTELCKEAAVRGMRIVLDGVFNHTGADSQYFNKYGNYPDLGAYQSRDSIYFNWYHFDNFPDNYRSWWGFKNLPQLNCEHKDVRRFFLDAEDAIIKRWIRHGASGWRLDVVDELSDDYVENLRRELKALDPDAVIIGEVWEDASNKIAYGQRRKYFNGGELDGVMNYLFRNYFIDFFTGKITGHELSARVMSMVENYPAESLYCSMNLITSHDISRASMMLAEAPQNLTRRQKAAYRLSSEQIDISKKRMRPLVALQMCFMGAPSIYYGDEAGMCSFDDPFNRSCYPWGDEDGNLIGFYRKVTAIRAENQVLRTGFFEQIYSDTFVYAFVRHGENGQDIFGNPCAGEPIIFALNVARYDHYRLNLDVAKWGISAAVDLLSGECYETKNGMLEIDLSTTDFKILKKKF